MPEFPVSAIVLASALAASLFILRRRRNGTAYGERTSLRQVTSEYVKALGYAASEDVRKITKYFV
jgi:hypothetical protein